MITAIVRFKLPANIDAEKTILGAILLDNSFHSEAAEKLEADDFSLDSHKRIFLRMSDLMNEQRAVDIVTLSHEPGVGFAASREEADDFRRQTRRLEQRLYRPSEREARDVEIAVQHLQEQLRFASADASLSGDASRRRDLGAFDDGERYERNRSSYDDRDSYRRADPRGDPFLIWQERDERGPH